MKTIYINILIAFIFISSTSVPLMAQAGICTECEECEGEEAGTEDAEFSAEIGEEGSEMGIEEADMMGTEALELGAEVEEIGTEIASETLAASSFLDAIPGVGEIVAVVEVFVMVGIAIYELFHAEAEEHRRAEEARKREKMLHEMSGLYNLPLIPRLSFAADDLDGSSDTLSYVFFLKSQMSYLDYKEYLKKNKITQHINKRYPIEKMTDFISYAFSSFFAPIKEISSSRLFVRRIPDIDIDVSNTATKQATVKVKSSWFHKVAYKNENLRQLELTTTSQMRVVLASHTKKGFQELDTIPYTAEKTGDIVAIRIKEFDITEHNNQSLWILIKANAHNSYGQKDGKNRFPTFSGVSQPGVSEKTLMYFRVHDYQPRDTEESITTKQSNLDSTTVINPFPIIHTSGRSKYRNDSITSPDYGKSHLRIDIPYNSDWKLIDRIELEILNSGVMVVLNFEKLKVIKNDWKFSMRGHYNNATSSNNNLETKAITYIDDQPSLSDYEYKTVPDHTKHINKFLLKNVPVCAGDIVNVSTFYKDGSVTRKVITNRSVANNIFPRDYYYLKNKNGFYLNYGTKTPGKSVSSNKLNFVNDSTLASFWLIEHQGGGAYALMEKASKKVLGIINGEVGLYDWEQYNNNLLWDIQFIADGDKFKLISIGQHAFLSVETSVNDSIDFNFTDGIEFTFTRENAAESILSGDPAYLINRVTQKVLDVSQGDPVMASKDTSPLSDQLCKFEYTGCLHYSIYNESIQKYLYYDRWKGLQWNDTEKTEWLLTPMDSCFILTTKQKPLYSEIDDKSKIDIDVSYKPSISEYKYHFSRLYYRFTDLIAHYTLNDDATDSTPYANHGSAYNGVSYVDDPIRGKVAQFDGADDYINTNFDFDPKDYNGDLTVSCWMKTTDWGSYDATLMRGKPFCLKRYGSGNRVSGVIWNNSNGANYLYGKDVADNRWHQIIMSIDTQDESTITTKLYIDGEYNSQKSVTQPLSNDKENTFIGNWLKNPNSSNSGYKGYLDDVKIWKKALTQEEIATEFKNADKSLIAHYAFDGDATDHSGHEHHGTTHGNMSFINDTQRGMVAIFDGVGDYLDTNFDFDALDYNGELTVSCWVKAYTWGDSNARLFAAGNWTIFRTSIHSGVKFYTWHSNNRLYYTQANADLEDNTWHSIAIVIKTQNNNSVKKELFIDGIRQSWNTVQYGLLDRPATNLIIGKVTPQNSYKGRIDDIKIWGKALSSGEIYSEYRNGLLSGSLHTKAQVQLTANRKNLILYPNESSDGHFNLSFSLADKGEVSYRIINLSGKILQSDSAHFQKGNHVWRITTNDLPNGVYVIEVTTALWKETRQILIRS